MSILPTLTQNNQALGPNQPGISKMEGLFGDQVTRHCQPEEGAMPHAHHFGRSETPVYLHFLRACLGFQATLVLCPRPGLASDSEGKLCPRANGNFNALQKAWVPLGPLADPSISTLAFPEKGSLTPRPSSPLQRTNVAQRQPWGQYQGLKDEKLMTFPSFLSGSAIEALPWERWDGRK